MSRNSRFNLLLTRFGQPFELSTSYKAFDGNNRLLAINSYRGFLCVCEDLMEQKGYDEKRRDQILSGLSHLFCESDFSDCILTLKYAYDVLIEHVSGKRVLSNYGDFKDRVESKYGFYSGFLFSVIRSDIQVILLNGVNLVENTDNRIIKMSLKRCSQYLLFCSKLQFTNTELEAAGISDYLMCETENRTHAQWGSLPVTKLVQNKLSLWLKDFDYVLHDCNHGPGSTADVGNIRMYKDLALATDQLLDYAKSRNIHRYVPLPAVRESGLPLERCSKLVFVPKNITKLRSISMEPTVLQYYQQGVMKYMMHYFERNKYLKNILHLKDSYVNKSFAYHGSITDDYATIDLSHASDSVTLDLVRVLFKRTSPNLYRWLIATRSTHTELPDGRIVKLTKFAPMGSALCFPIESLIFAAISAVAIDLSRGKQTRLQGYSDISRTFKVFGDDIIVSTGAAQLTVNLLKLYGFTPNSDKSFLKGPFKESCGGNYFRGYDITPIKFSTTYDTSFEEKGGISPSAYTSLCGYANLAYSHELYMFRLFCIHSLLDNGFKPIFCSSLAKSPMIYSPTPTNFHLKKVPRESKSIYRTNFQRTDLCADSIRTIAIHPKTRTMAYRALCAHLLYDLALQKRRRSDIEELLNCVISKEDDGLCITFDHDTPLTISALRNSATVHKRGLVCPYGQTYEVIL